MSALEEINNEAVDPVYMAESEIIGNKAAMEALRHYILHLDVQSILESFKTLSLGFIMHGPPGTGKRSLVQAVAKECGSHLTVISPHSVYAREEHLPEAFSLAASRALPGKPAVIYIPEIDVLCPHYDSRGPQDARITSNLLALMETMERPSDPLVRVVVVASAQKIDVIHPRLLHRLYRKVEIKAPTKEERFHILELFARKLSLGPNVDLRAIAASCIGYVGADLEKLCREAFFKSREVDGIAGESCLISLEDWEHARMVVGPGAEIPKVLWDDIGGLKAVKEKLKEAVWKIEHHAEITNFGVSAAFYGVLLHGPPGCSKTTLALAAVTAAVNAAQASFFRLSGAEIIAGKGNALLKDTFQKASHEAPSIIFVDEADLVFAKRRGNRDDMHLLTLFAEMDRLEGDKDNLGNGILMIAATNRFHTLDHALVRAGRLGEVLYVPPPDSEARYEILAVHTRKVKIGSDVNLRRVAEDTKFFTGAELKRLCEEAERASLRDMSYPTLFDNHFRIAKKLVKPRFTKEELESYASLKTSM